MPFEQCCENWNKMKNKKRKTFTQQENGVVMQAEFCRTRLRKQQSKLVKFKLLKFVNLWTYEFLACWKEVLEISSNILARLLVENVITNWFFFVL